MKLIGIVSTASLSLLLGITLTAVAQEQREPEGKQAQQEEKRAPEAKPAQKEEKRSPEAKPQAEQKAQEAKPAQQQEKRAQEPKPAEQKQTEQKAQQERQSDQKQQAEKAQQDRQQQPNKPQASDQREAHARPAARTPQQQKVVQTAFTEHRANNWQSDHRNWQQRGGYHGYRIPDDRFRGYFGSDHGFRIEGLPFLVVGGFPRFQYDGYWFSIIDPWPGSWANDWYDTDDVYVVYVDNGYYLYNRRYPDVGMAISISM